MRFLSFLLLLIILALTSHCCLSHQNTTNILCIERDRVALLEFKHDLIDGANWLVSWGSEEDDCCKWVEIVCDNFTGHVHEIRLRGLDFSGIDLYDFPGYGERWVQKLQGNINPSLLNLKQLEYLDLSNNYFGGVQLPAFIGSLHRLRYLNLSSSWFSGEIPHQLGNLSSLRVLGLSSYAFSSNLRWLSGLSMLQDLDMSNVDLSKAFDWIQVINSLPSLVKLRLSYCGLNNMPLDPLPNNNFSSLSVLDLSFNYFDESSLVPTWIFGTKSLVSLDLSWCHLNDLRGDVFHNMTSIRKLRVSRNHFMNSPTILKGLSRVGSGLAALDVSYCDLSSSSLSHLTNMTSLVSLDLSSNQLTNKIPESLGNLCNLRHLDLSENNFREISLFVVLKTFLDCKSSKLESLVVHESHISGHLPKQLGKLDNLVGLDLGNNLLSGSIPNSIGRLSSLRILDLRENQLVGSLPLCIGQLGELKTIDIEDNMLIGMVTQDHFTNLTNLEVLMASNNVLTLKLQFANWAPPFHLQRLGLNSWNLGPQFPLWLRSQTRLLVLDIGNARISDSMPNWFWSRLSNLAYLKLSYNQIQASLSIIPASLHTLDLNSNNFSGPLPKLSNRSFISDLDLSNNSFLGSLTPLLCPKVETGNLLYFLNLSNNNLSGVIPQCWEKWQMLSLLDLENNDLSGELPSSLGNLSELVSLNMRKNKLFGILPVSLMDLTSLQILQLSYNELAGSIPSWLGRQLMGLKILELRSNEFSGAISFELCHLASLQVLDLAYNNLSGTIPACFNNFSVMSGKKALGKEMHMGGIPTIGSASIAMRGREDKYSSILGLVTMLDLSNNIFFGHIPYELMSLIALRSMSLATNHLTGRIPEKIGDMKALEYLNLSSNQLYGEIPLSLSDLSFLSSLNLSYNNLTGRIPISTQIQGLNSSSFVGNRLCGPPLTKVCGVAANNDDVQGIEERNNMTNEVDWGFVISILLGFFVGFWVVVGPLIVNRLWRFKYFQIVNKVLCGIYDVICKHFA